MADTNNRARREYGSGSISQRKDGTWTARLVIGVNEKGKPRIKALYGKTEREVKKKLKEFQKEFHKNDTMVVQKSTVENYMTNWLQSNKRNSLKPKSYDRLEQTIKYQVIPNIGHIQLAAIQPNDIQQMVNKLAEDGLSYSTIKKAYDAVNDCFRTGVIQRSVTFNPALGVTIPAKKSFGKTKIKCYTEEETKRLCSAAISTYSNGKRVYRLGDAIILDVNTGLRMAELLALKWSDIDLDDRILSVNSTRVVVRDREGISDNKYVVIEQDTAKTQSGIRDIAINNDAYDALLRLKEITGAFEYVLSTRNGDPIIPRYLDRMFRKIAVAAGFSDDKIYGLHSLRHTFASRLFANGADVKTVSEILGHSDITITYNTYIHLIDGQKKRAIQF